MAFEVLKLILDRTPVADARGYFFNPWTMRVERPRNPVAALVLARAVVSAPVKAADTAAERSV